MEQNTVNSTNPIKYMNFSEFDTTINKACPYSNDIFPGYPNTLTNLSNHQLYAMKNLLGYNKYYENEICGQLMSPLFYSDDLIPPNTPISIKYTIDSNYHTNIVSIAGSNVAALGSQNFAIAKLENGPLPQSTTKNTLIVGIADINLWLYRYHMPDVPLWLMRYTSNNLIVFYIQLLREIMTNLMFHFVKIVV